MAIHEHYLPEDFNQVSAHLDIIHKSLMNILKATTEAQFEQGIIAKIQLEKSYQVLETLHKKKLQRDDLVGADIMNRNYFIRS